MLCIEISLIIQDGSKKTALYWPSTRFILPVLVDSPVDLWAKNERWWRIVRISRLCCSISAYFKSHAALWLVVTPAGPVTRRKNWSISRSGLLRRGSFVRHRSFWGFSAFGNRRSGLVHRRELIRRWVLFVELSFVIRALFVVRFSLPLSHSFWTLCSACNHERVHQGISIQCIIVSLYSYVLCLSVVDASS